MSELFVCQRPLPEMNLKLLLPLAALSALSACSTPAQLTLDAKVRELCARDGGIQVFETVILPPSKFNQHGQVNFYRPVDGLNALGLDYKFKSELQYLKKGSDYGDTPSLARREISVTRKSDGKLLGIAVAYERWGGGPLAGFVHPNNGVSCPGRYGSFDLLNRVFVRGSE